MYILLLMCVIIGGSVIGTDAKLYYGNKPLKGMTTYEVAGQGGWFLGRQICEKKNMRLVRIYSQSKSDDVHDYISTLNKNDIPGPFWTLAERLFDGTTWAFDVGDPVKFFNWGKGEPHSGDDDCVAVDRDGIWHNKNCANKYFILCETY